MAGLKAVANAEGWPGYETDHIHDTVITLSRDIGEQMVFKVNAGAVGSPSGGTKLLVNSGVASAARKHKGSGFAWALAEMSEIEVTAVSDFTVIALSPTHY